MKYIIASVEGLRHDLAPEYTGKFGKVYRYGHFNLIIFSEGDWTHDYDEAYKEIAEYVRKVNRELKGNRYYNGWMYAEMLTPNEHEEYNDIHVHYFHDWLASKIVNADELVVSTIQDIPNGRWKVYGNEKDAFRVARVASNDLLLSIQCPGEYRHAQAVKYDKNVTPNQPIFEFGYASTVSIQIIDKSYSDVFQSEEEKKRLESLFGKREEE